MAVAINSSHAEAHTNLGVLEVRAGDKGAAMGHYAKAQQLAEHAYEPWYNGALLASREGNVEQAFKQVTKALEAYPEHVDSQELRKELQAQLLSC